MTNLFGIIGIFILGSTGLLSIFMFAKKSKPSISWGLFSACVSVWGLAGFFIAESIKENEAIFWWKFAYLGVIQIPIFLNLFVYYFLELKSKINIIQVFLVSLIGGVFLFFNFLNHSFIAGVKYKFNQFFYISSPTPLYSLFVGFFVLIIFYNLLRLGLAYRASSDKLYKKRVNYIIVGLIIGFAGGSLSFLPVYDMNVYPYANLSIAIGVFIVGYAILKYRLLDIKIIATEIFATLIPLFLLVDAFLSKTKTEMIFKGTLFLAVSSFSVLLIRSILKEVKIREQLAALTEELKKANEDLKKLDKAKSEFISIASHQLRTPLSVIKGYISMLLEGSYGEVPEKAKDVLSKMEANNQRLNNLIDDLLDLSRIEGGRMQFEWAFISFAELIQSVVSDLKMVAEKKGLTFKWINEAPEKMYVRADKEKLRQVVMNLIDNAIKYTPQGSIEVKLVKTKENKARLAIKDTGIGMDAEELALLFGKFVRGKKTPRLWTEGSGLGLYVAKKIIEEHKGNVWAESEGEGKGSTFFVELPVY